MDADTPSLSMPSMVTTRRIKPGLPSFANEHNPMRTKRCRRNGSIVNPSLLHTRSIRSSVLEKILNNSVIDWKKFYSCLARINWFYRREASWSSGVVCRLQITTWPPLSTQYSGIRLAGETVNELPKTNNTSAALDSAMLRPKACSGSCSPKWIIESKSHSPHEHFRPVREREHIAKKKGISRRRHRTETHKNESINIWKPTSFVVAISATAAIVAKIFATAFLAVFQIGVAMKLG